jgi:hypothetical protein
MVSDSELVTRGWSVQMCRKSKGLVVAWLLQDAGSGKCYCSGLLHRLQNLVRGPTSTRGAVASSASPRSNHKAGQTTKQQKRVCRSGAYYGSKFMFACPRCRKRELSRVLALVSAALFCGQTLALCREKGPVGQATRNLATQRKKRQRATKKVPIVGCRNFVDG